MRIQQDDLSGHEITELLRRHFERLRASSPPESCHVLPIEGLRSPEVTVFSAWEGDAILGCGALKQLDPTHGEIKSMRTVEAHLGRGVGAALVDHLIETARARGYARLSLETGRSVDFAPARRLYARHGFSECGPFGDYVLDPFSVFMTRAL